MAVATRIGMVVSECAVLETPRHSGLPVWQLAGIYASVFFLLKKKNYWYISRYSVQANPRARHAPGYLTSPL